MSEPTKHLASESPLAALGIWLRKLIREEIQAAMGQQNGNGSPVQQSPALLTTDELADKLHVKKSHIYDLTHNMENPIPHVYVGRYLGFELSKVLAWGERQKKN